MPINLAQALISLIPSFILSAPPAPRITPNSNIRVYFTPGPDCEDNIIKEINNAQKTIDVAVYSITNDKIADNLIAAHNRGVRVRIISDRLQSTHTASKISRLGASGIPITLNNKHKIMHNKFAIFDNRCIETGSYNWTTMATKSNAENCLFLSETYELFDIQFKYLWNLYKL